ncbi:MAG: hypothetical protein HQM10_10940 [Candidatus Riflebacteria bacterium]|nr:hypothetical protein [Candidatus Riflebacteria bacterium]
MLEAIIVWGIFMWVFTLFVRSLLRIINGQGKGCGHCNSGCSVKYRCHSFVNPHAGKAKKDPLSAPSYTNQN